MPAEAVSAGFIDTILKYGWLAASTVLGWMGVEHRNLRKRVDTLEAQHVSEERLRVILSDQITPMREQMARMDLGQDRIHQRMDSMGSEVSQSSKDLAYLTGRLKQRESRGEPS